MFYTCIEKKKTYTPFLHKQCMINNLQGLSLVPYFLSQNISYRVEEDGDNEHNGKDDSKSQLLKTIETCTLGGGGGGGGVETKFM